MKFVVLNGSPKGKYSITLQYVNFLDKTYPDHEFEIFHVAQLIKKLEKNESTFSAIIDRVREADAVIWSFGLFVLAVPAQYMRFIELIGERGHEKAFAEKYTAVISTSIHYYDHTAHNYLRAVCEDLKMRFIEGISFDILDLMKSDKREQLLHFAENIFDTVGKDRRTSSLFQPLRFSDFRYEPELATDIIDNRGKKILILVDAFDGTSNLGKMIDRVKGIFSAGVELVDLRDIEIHGACLGCMKCGYENQCQYRDGFSDFYNGTVRQADIIVFAGTVRGRYLSSRWKTFFDRAFFWNHTPSLTGKQMAYLISGPLSQNANLIQILEASVTDRQEGNLVDIITDECENSWEIDARIDSLCNRMLSFSEKKYIKPFNFLAVGGHKIFRDDVWGRLRPLWQADHRHYKKRGWYDFPQKDMKTRVINPLMMLATKIPAVRKKYYNGIMKFPAARFEQMIDKITGKKS